MGLKLNGKQIAAIEQILDKRECVELIATKDEIKVIHIKRKQVNT